MLKRFRSAAEHTDHASWFATRANKLHKLHKLHSKAMWEKMVKQHDVNHCEHSAFLPGSLVPRSLLDFISQLWKKNLTWLRDKIWEWPGNEASYQAPPSQLFGSIVYIMCLKARRSLHETEAMNTLIPLLDYM